MEKGSLQHLHRMEAPPSDIAWLEICEALDKQMVQDTLRLSEQTPSDRVWADIGKKFRTKKRKRTGAVLLMTTVAALLLLIVQTTNRSTAPISSNNTGLTKSRVTPKIKTIESDRSGGDAAGEQVNTSAKQATERVMAAAEKTSTQNQDRKYLWVAGKNGVPFCIPERWEKVSCCLSGEEASKDCFEQRNQWHTELLETDLGFHADPLLGLMALLRSNAGSDNN